jgi:hypothetical protein
MNQKLRLFAIHRTATSLQHTYNLNPRTRWYPALDESNQMQSAYFTIHPGKNPPPQNGCQLKSAPLFLYIKKALVSHPPLSQFNRTFHKTDRPPLHQTPVLPGHWFVWSRLWHAIISLHFPPCEWMSWVDFGTPQIPKFTQIKGHIFIYFLPYFHQKKLQCLTVSAMLLGFVFKQNQPKDTHIHPYNNSNSCPLKSCRYLSTPPTIYSNKLDIMLMWALKGQNKISHMWLKSPIYVCMSRHTLCCPP